MRNANVRGRAEHDKAEACHGASWLEVVLDFQARPAARPRDLGLDGMEKGA